MSVKGIKSIDLTFVAYNHLNQEKWIYRNKDKIASTMSIGVGGTFDYVIGIQKMPPTVIKKLHLSWLYRLTMEPWRFSRVAKAFPVFPIKVFLDSVKQ
jgi:N-acetylglucosaminyldiphosphoundecaprenol N-acetyl-beta-D-mannosaminyltransferase